MLDKQTNRQKDNKTIRQLAGIRMKREIRGEETERESESERERERDRDGMS